MTSAQGTTPSGRQSLVGFARLSATPPPVRELLDVRDDGEASLWRSSGRAVGRFGGPVADIERLRAAVAASASAEIPSPVELAPDAAWEQVDANGRTARFAADDPARGPWEPLVDACRALVDALVESPVAAIDAEVTPDGHVLLRHRGTEALAIELAALEVRFTLWRDGREVAVARAANPGLERVEAGPGWSLELSAPALDLAGGGTLVAVASFVADDAGVYVPVSITAHATVSR